MAAKSERMQAQRNASQGRVLRSSTAAKEAKPVTEPIQLQAETRSTAGSKKPASKSAQASVQDSAPIGRVTRSATEAERSKQKAATVTSEAAEKPRSKTQQSKPVLKSQNVKKAAKTAPKIASEVKFESQPAPEVKIESKPAPTRVSATSRKPVPKTSGKPVPTPSTVPHPESGAANAASAAPAIVPKLEPEPVLEAETAAAASRRVTWAVQFDRTAKLKAMVAIKSLFEKRPKNKPGFVKDQMQMPTAAVPAVANSQDHLQAYCRTRSAIAAKKSNLKAVSKYPIDDEDWSSYAAVDVKAKPAVMTRSAAKISGEAPIMETTTKPNENPIEVITSETVTITEDNAKSMPATAESLEIGEDAKSLVMMNHRKTRRGFYIVTDMEMSINEE